MFVLIPLKEECQKNFMFDMQEAFQKGAEAEFGGLDMEILPAGDIERSLAAKGSAAYQAMVDGEMVGGAIVVIDEDATRGHLDFLYVKCGRQGDGIGKKIWDTLEEMYSKVRVWETVTPYFEKRNIHFYINCCRFHAVELYGPKHKAPHMSADADGENEYMFRFEKVV